MSVIDDFFNTSSFLVENLVADPFVEPDVAYAFNFYIYDKIKSLTAKSLDIEMYVKDGRNETLITNTPIAYLTAANTWRVSSVIPAGEWDGSKGILLKFTIEDLNGLFHTVDYMLVKE